MPNQPEPRGALNSPLRFPKTLELEQRLARNEVLVKDLQDLVTTLQKRVTALQAQLDRIASLSRY